MQKIKLFFSSLCLITVLSACAGSAEPTATETAPLETVVVPTSASSEPTLAPPEETEGYPPPAATADAYPAPPEEPAGYPAPTEGTPILMPPVPVTFSSVDGTQLAGNFYPPLTAPAPVVVLMHQFGSDQHQWDALALWLQTGNPPEGNDWLPPLPDGLTFAVFTFDFRGHGESEGNSILDSGLLQDAQSAVAFAKTQTGVDPARVITIGTSIGSDGAVDACIALNGTDVAESQASQGCLGAMAFSPGSFIEVNYTAAANIFLGEPHFATIYCLAAEDDGPSPALCNSVTGERYRAVVYPGSAHGMSLLKGDLEPNVGDLILEFLLESLQLRQ